MKRMFVMFRDPDMGGSTGGGSQSAAPSAGAPQTAQAPAEGNLGNDSNSQAAVPQNQGSDQSEASQLFSRLEKGEKLSQEELLKAHSAMANPAVPESDPNAAQNPEEKVDKAPIPEAIQQKLNKGFEMVGAKDIDEWIAKTSELVNKDRAEGGRLGRENKKLNDAITGQGKLMRGILEGNAEAIAMGRKLLNLPQGQTQQPQANQAPNANQQPANLSPEMSAMLLTDQEIESSLDPAALRAMNNRMKTIMQTMQAKIDEKLQPVMQQYNQQAESLERQRANDSVMNDLVGLATQFKDIYGIESGNIRELLNDFARTGNIDPRIKELIDTANTMVEMNLPSIEIAHKVRFFDKVADHTPAVLAATEAQRKKILNQIPTVGAAGSVQGATQNYTQPQLQAIADKKAPVPKEWFNEQGRFDLNRIPADARQILGL